MPCHTNLEQMVFHMHTRARTRTHTHHARVRTCAVHAHTRTHAPQTHIPAGLPAAAASTCPTPPARPCTSSPPRCGGGWAPPAAPRCRSARGRSTCAPLIHISMPTLEEVYEKSKKSMALIGHQCRARPQDLGARRVCACMRACVQACAACVGGSSGVLLGPNAGHCWLFGPEIMVTLDSNLTMQATAGCSRASHHLAASPPLPADPSCAWRASAGGAAAAPNPAPCFGARSSPGCAPSRRPHLACGRR